MKVYVVTQGDTGSEPGYIACASVFATKEAAQRCIEQSVAEDEECFEEKAKWHDGRTFAVIERFDGRTIAYKLEEMKVQS